MGLDNVITKVQHDGDETAKKLISDAEQQAEKTLQDARNHAAELLARKKEETDRQIKALKIQEENSLEIEKKKIRLNAEKEVLQQAFTNCLAALQQLPRDKTLMALLANAAKELPDATYVSANPKDAPIVRQLTKLQYAGTIDCQGGIIVENTDRSLKLDLRYETLAASTWDAHLKEIANLLLR